MNYITLRPFILANVYVLSTLSCLSHCYVCIKVLQLFLFGDIQTRIWCPLCKGCLLEIPRKALQTVVLLLCLFHTFVNGTLERFICCIQLTYKNNGILQLVLEQVLVFGMKLVTESSIKLLNKHKE